GNLMRGSMMVEGRIARFVTLVKQQLTREYASGRFTGGLDAMKRELERRVKERMLMSRGNNYTRLAVVRSYRPAEFPV
ncbi:hypothetical protein ABKV78_23225, partial (plasmid) [Enterobacter asburiae]